VDEGKGLREGGEEDDLLPLPVELPQKLEKTREFR